MKVMIMVANLNYVAFFNLDQEEQAVQARKDDPRLRYARIANVIQAYPSQIEVGAVYQRGSPVPEAEDSRQFKAEAEDSE